ncbi:MAG TPA: hypothetical protein VJT15_01415 [Pyrinomonadaceae bacterium]|nr:hypothetical protein [Pyrinomonadaceae bacterium]
MAHLPLKRLVAVVLVTLVVGSVIVAGSQQNPRAGVAKLLQVEGEVTVNGTAAISGATVFSDSTMTTAARSSAVVSLGKLGRVEVFPSSTMKLTFGDPSVSVAMLEAGRVRVSSSSGVNASVNTPEGNIRTTNKQRNEFIVDTTCGNTFISVKKGSVDLRTGDNVKQIAAGNQDTAGTARPGCTPAP